jgi:hypothetical protein
MSVGKTRMKRGPRRRARSATNPYGSSSPADRGCCDHRDLALPLAVAALPDALALAAGARGRHRASCCGAAAASAGAQASSAGSVGLDLQSWNRLAAADRAHKHAALRVGCGCRLRSTLCAFLRPMIGHYSDNSDAAFARR